MQVFAERGVGANRIEVAAAVGVSRATLYRYQQLSSACRAPGCVAGELAAGSPL